MTKSNDRSLTVQKQHIIIASFILVNARLLRNITRYRVTICNSNPNDIQSAHLQKKYLVDLI